MCSYDDAAVYRMSMWRNENAVAIRVSVCVNEDVGTVKMKSM
jgi:hypothetical protein